MKKIVIRLSILIWLRSRNYDRSITNNLNYKTTSLNLAWKLWLLFQLSTKRVASHQVQSFRFLKFEMETYLYTIRSIDCKIVDSKSKEKTQPEMNSIVLGKYLYQIQNWRNVKWWFKGSLSMFESVPILVNLSKWLQRPLKMSMTHTV